MLWPVKCGMTIYVKFWKIFGTEVNNSRQNITTIIHTSSFLQAQRTVWAHYVINCRSLNDQVIWVWLRDNLHILTFLVTIFSLFHPGFHSLKIPWYTSFFISVVVATVISLLIRLVVVPIFYKESGREPSSETTSLVQGLPSYEQLELINSKPNIPSKFIWFKKNQSTVDY